MLRKLRPSPKLFSDFNTLQFASVMAMVVFVMLLVFMTIPTYHQGNSVDLPHVSHAVSMPGADREDAMLVSITRDGKAYLGTDQVNVTNLAAKIQDRLKDRGVERKVYVKADMRARWGTVKLVLDGVRSAGIIRVAFLVYPRPVTPMNSSPGS
jgi:biopolymer transport protein ExbD/biopolymer transport protein TolR